MFIKNIGVKIQIMGQIIGFLGIFVSLIMIFTGCANYFNYTYPDIEDMSTAILGFVFMLSSICTLYLTQGFGQLIINSEKIASFISKEDQENLPNKTVESNVSKQKIVPEPVLQQKKEYHMVDISKYQDQGIHKLCFIAFNREDIEKTKIFLPNYHFIVHEMFSQHSINGEIIKKGMDKGLAIKKVVETLHMKMEDTIAFGDSMNDYEMLQVCNYGVAMKNACQELKASADNICESVENDGVYYEMERLGLFECLD